LVQVTGSSRRFRGPNVRRRLARALGLATALALSLCACGASKPSRPDRFYSLEPAPLAQPSGPPLTAVLQVNHLAAQGFVGGSQIVFRVREEPQLVQRYDDLLWADPPPRALAQALAKGIRAAGIFSFVAIPADRARADYLLGGEVVRFEHLPTEQPPRVAATLGLSLVRADDRRTVASREYRGEEPVTGSSPDDMASAFYRLTARLVAEAVRDLRALAPQLGQADAPAGNRAR
jgi:cholesterol transport system auxiliary component